MENETYLIDGFEYQYSKGKRIVGIIVAEEEEIEFIFRPNTKLYSKIIKW